eukprot:jgi/Astpho2/6240/fgenesh1_pg.00088_%23_51_t
MSRDNARLEKMDSPRVQSRSDSRSSADFQPQLALLSGWVYRESGVVSGISNRRWGSLFSHSFVTFRKEGSREPSKVWPLHGHCKLSSVERKEVMIRNRHTSTIWALAAGHYEKKQLWCFTIKWPSYHFFSKDDLKLCFDEQEEADRQVLSACCVDCMVPDLQWTRWRQAIRQGILDLQEGIEGSAPSAMPEASRLRTASVSALPHHLLASPADSFATPRTPAGSIGIGSALNSSPLGSASPRASRPSVPAPAITSTPRVTDQFMPLANTDSQAAALGIRGASLAGTKSTEDEGPQVGPIHQPKRKWASLRHVNGVAVYQEEAGPHGEGGAFMISAVVRSTPRACAKALLSTDTADEEAPFAANMQVLENLDAQCRVVMGAMFPSGGLAGKVCAPREMVVEQTWREEEDGTVIVLFHTTRHRYAREAPRTWFGSWWQPVRAQIAAAGYTICPLQQRYTVNGESQECLVTLVLKLDLGGWLGDHSRMAWALAPITQRLNANFVEQLLMSVVFLRDKVEQERFVVKPFNLGQQSDPAAYERSADFLGRQKSGTGAAGSGLMRSPSMFVQARSSTEAGKGHPAPAGISVRATAGTASPAAPAGGTAAEGAALKPAGGTPSAGPAPAGGAENLWPRGTCAQRYWSCPGAAGYKIRGPTYLRDKKKVMAEEPVFGLASVDLVELDAPTLHVAQHLPSIKNSKAPFTFVLQLMVPGPPYLSLTMAWAAEYDPSAALNDAGTPKSPEGPDGESDSELTQSPFDLCLARFLAGDDREAEQRRHRSFKLIPSVVHGSWVIKQSVGNTPVMLGKKLTTKYFRGPGYFEVDVDVGSSRAAASAVGLVRGATTSLCIDMAILLEGHSDEELPERLLGTVRFDRLDLTSAAYLEKDQQRRAIIVCLIVA